MEAEKFIYFQYFKEMTYPIYLKIGENSLTPHLSDVFSKMGFSEFPVINGENIEEKVRLTNHARILKVQSAGPRLEGHINRSLDTDQYGQEQITPKSGYRIYRYKNFGLMVYSNLAKEWELGVSKVHFAQDEERRWEILLTRFLSLALAPLGIMGFWSVPVEEGIVVMNQGDSHNEVVFVDLNKNAMLTWDGVKMIDGYLNFIRLDPVLKSDTIKMNNEELYSFLLFHTSFFDYGPTHSQLKETLKKLLSYGRGIVHPSEEFRPRTETDLSPA